MSDELQRWLLPAYLITFFLTCFVWRSWRVWRETGINPLVPTPGDDAHDFVGRIFRLLVGVTGAVALTYAVDPDGAYVAPFTWAEGDAARLVGWALLLVALIWTFIAQAQMGKSWRIGVDAKHATALVATGLFTRSRNPIFVGIIVALTGYLLVLPNALTLSIWTLGVVLINVQVRLEEAHLSKLHGAAYDAYRARVGRWL
jgi:protein-S-isoprenylcysteine O-methyltransferase Ste14